MPGYELVGREEFLQISEIFEKGGGVFFRMGFDAKRNGVFKVKEFESKFATYMETPHALAVSSGTAALKVALEALGIGSGDEVITQAFTFVATVEAIIETGATPKIAQINESLNICPISLKANISSKTKAIIVVHMLGVPSQMDEIMVIAKSRGIPIIEDTAWGCGGKYNGKFLGTIGDLGTYSFDNAKAMTTGEGGMVVTRNQALDSKARAYHDHGHDNNPSVPRWVDTRSSSGFNFRMTELQGAVGLAQLSKLSFVIAEQRRIHTVLSNILRDFSVLKERPIPSNSEPTCDAFVFSTSSKQMALKCREFLLREGIGTKILPEALTWHFAGNWNHMRELVESHQPELGTLLRSSEDILTRHVAISINLGYNHIEFTAIKRALEGATGV
jgi:8-amino-3,8-dideoxy-alpha-D-manno-octulosonate transaminase